MSSIPPICTIYNEENTFVVAHVNIENQTYILSPSEGYQSDFDRAEINVFIDILIYIKYDHILQKIQED